MSICEYTNQILFLCWTAFFCDSKEIVQGFAIKFFQKEPLVKDQILYKIVSKLLIHLTIMESNQMMVLLNTLEFVIGIFFN